MSARHGYYGRMARESSLSASDALAQARLFRDLLAETDAVLRDAYKAGRLPDGVMPHDLINRTAAALAGVTIPKPLTVSEAVAAAVDRLTLEGTY